MPATPTTIVDLSRLNLSHGDGKRIELPVRLEPFELGGQTYVASPVSVQVRLEISRPSGGFAFRIQFPVHLEGPCMRCLERPARPIEPRGQRLLTTKKTLRSPYVETTSTFDIGRWAHDATSSPSPDILCQPRRLASAPPQAPPNDANPATTTRAAKDPRWAELTI